MLFYFIKSTQCKEKSVKILVIFPNSTLIFSLYFKIPIDSCCGLSYAHVWVHWFFPSLLNKDYIFLFLCYCNFWWNVSTACKIIWAEVIFKSIKWHPVHKGCQDSWASQFGVQFTGVFWAKSWPGPSNTWSPNLHSECEDAWGDNL